MRSFRDDSEPVNCPVSVCVHTASRACGAVGRWCDLRLQLRPVDLYLLRGIYDNSNREGGSGIIQSATRYQSSPKRSYGKASRCLRCCPPPDKRNRRGFATACIYGKAVLISGRNSKRLHKRLRNLAVIGYRQRCGSAIGVGTVAAKSKIA